jgi:hypothetical protein
MDHIENLSEIDPAHDRSSLKRLIDAACSWLRPFEPSEDRPRVEAVGQPSRSARWSASSAAVSPRPANCPRRLDRPRLSSTRTTLSSSVKSTSSPGAIPNWSRMALGITTCPFGPTREVILISITEGGHIFDPGRP